jgi:HD-like signal output (HDOD) protein
MAQSGVDLCVAEEKVFGANHADVGGYLIGLWGLPAPVVEAVALHHTPARATIQIFSPLTSVHAANVLEWERNKSAQDTPAPQLDTEYVGRVSDLSRVPVWRAAVPET